MHIHEDAVIMEICVVETSQPVVTSLSRGNIFITSLCKPQRAKIRFNVNDVSAFHQARPMRLRQRAVARLDKIYGRNDNMIKLRGVNVFPEAVGALVAEDARCTGEYFCLVERSGEAGREDMTVMVELRDAADAILVQASLDRRFKEGLGVKCIVRPVARGELDSHTGVAQTSKIKRVLDRRNEKK